MYTFLQMNKKITFITGKAISRLNEINWVNIFELLQCLKKKLIDKKIAKFKDIVHSSVHSFEWNMAVMGRMCISF